jgi:predicted MPP superfamily phosphohydrolase
MKQVSEEAMLSKLPRNQFTLFLKHRPVIDNETRGLFDLQLSGHTHKGQIFPFSIITKLYYPNQAGLLALEKNTHLYVSRGTGTWGPPIRFLASPEVTIIDLIHQ